MRVASWRTHWFASTDIGDIVILGYCGKTQRPHALSQVAAIRTGSCPPGWRRNSWLQQIADGTPFGICAEWIRARRRGHTGMGLTEWTSAIYAIWWWWWCWCWCWGRLWYHHHQYHYPHGTFVWCHLPKKPTASDAFKTLLKIYRFNGFQNTVAANTAMFKMSIIAPALNSRVSIQADVKWIASSCGSSRCPLPALLFRYVSIKKTWSQLLTQEQHKEDATVAIFCGWITSTVKRLSHEINLYEGTAADC